MSYGSTVEKTELIIGCCVVHARQPRKRKVIRICSIPVGDNAEKLAISFLIKPSKLGLEAEPENRIAFLFACGKELACVRGLRFDGALAGAATASYPAVGQPQSASRACCMLSQLRAVTCFSPVDAFARRTDGNAGTRTNTNTTWVRQRMCVYFGHFAATAEVIAS